MNKRILSYGFIHDKVILVLLGLVVLIMTRQFPLSGLSALMNIGLMGVFAIAFYQVYINLKTSKPAIRIIFYGITIITGIYILIALLIYGHTISLIFRFGLILLLIILAYFIKPPVQFIKVFNIIVLIEALFVILLEAYLSINFNEISYQPIRYFFLHNNWGDVYTYNGWFYYIQVRGTAILPFAYMFSYLDPGKRYVRLRRWLLFFGVIFSGNFGYLVGIAFFHFFWFFRSFSLSGFRVKMFKAFFLLLIMILPALNFVTANLTRKSEKSLATRYDQAAVLMNDLGTSVASILFGRGLGNQISEKTSFRDYSTAVYYELQGLYFLNQMGVVFFTLFMLYNFIIALYNYSQRKWILLVYAAYIIYASTNPYFFDTTQIVVILMLNTLISFKQRGIWL